MTSEQVLVWAKIIEAQKSQMANLESLKHTEEFEVIRKNKKKTEEKTSRKNNIG